jgi:prevent-host-death family protein
MTIMTNQTIRQEVKTMSVRNWTVAEAKARFSELIERARVKGPQTITRHGRSAAVVVSVEEWERKAKRTGSLAEFFAGSPLRGSGIDVRRRKDRPRRVDL